MESTLALYDALVTALASVGLSSRIYMTAPPERVSYPYGLLAISGRLDGDYEGREQTGALELQIFGRPRSAQPDMEAIGDAAEKALRGLSIVEDDSKLRIVRRTSRDTLPPWPQPADREIVQVRITWDFEIGAGWLQDEEVSP